MEFVHDAKIILVGGDCTTSSFPCAMKVIQCLRMSYSDFLLTFQYCGGSRGSVTILLYFYRRVQLHGNELTVS